MDYASYLALGDRAYQSGQAIEARKAWIMAAGKVQHEVQANEMAGRFLSLGFLSEADAVLKLWSGSQASLASLALQSSLALERGDVEESLKVLERSSAFENLTLMSNALLISHYLTPEDPQAIKTKSLAWAKKAEAARFPLLGLNPHRSSFTHKVRIGFVSGDLCAHPVGFLILPILKALAERPNDVEIFIFDNGNQNDWVTDRLKALCQSEHWSEIRGLNDQEASLMIVRAELDALVDCSGHTSRLRLALFANRLAPLQISWGGYFSTTGLKTIDAVIMDHFHVPDGAENQFIEHIIRVPSRFIYAPPPACPPVTDVPYFQRSIITFGSFNNIAKINEHVISTWSMILRSVPGSRLILKWRCFADEAFCDEIRLRFSWYGIDPERITLRPLSIYRDTLSEYRDIDIALDPFPFTGGQTSLDALWMGVPLVTLAGISPVARQGHAFVNLIGKSGWSSSNVEDYVNCAINLARDPDALRTMRFDQRNLIYNSKLSDASTFIDILVNAIKTAGNAPKFLGR